MVKMKKLKKEIIDFVNQNKNSTRTEVARILGKDYYVIKKQLEQLVGEGVLKIEKFRDKEYFSVISKP